MRMTIQVKSKENVPLSRFFDTSPLMRRIASYLRGSTVKKITGGIGPANSALTRTVKGSGLTLRDRGQLQSSITSSSTHDTATVGTNHPGAPVHNPEDGRKETVIRPKTAKYLWIPASRETRTLQRRYGFDPTSCLRGMKASGYTVAFLPSKKKSGEKVVLATPPASGKGTKKNAKDAFPLFLLKKAVTIPARPFLFADERDQEEITRIIDEFYLAGGAT